MSANPLAKKRDSSGSRGGPVPPLTLAEAQAIFRKYREHEYGWVRVKILYLAREKGEFHADMLADVDLDQRNVIGAAVNALAKSKLITPTDEHRHAESSASHRRRSYVYEITDRGSVLLSEIDRRGGITTFNQPKGSKEMDLTKAKALVALALENEVLEGDAPSEDSKVIEEATGLVENAITAWNKNIRGPEVESLLMLDANWDEMDASDQEAAAAKFASAEPPADEPPAEDDNSNPFAKGKKKDEEKAEPDPEPEPEPEPSGDEGEGGGEDRVPPTAELIEAAKARITEAARDGDPDDDDYYDPEGDVAPFEDYDKVKVADFKKAFAEDWDSEQIAVVQLYEASHKGRPGIVNWTPDKAPAKTEEPKGDDKPADEPKTEDPTPETPADIPVTGTFVITKEQILEALASGSVTISV